MTRSRPLIALDADGVLLDYTLAYAQAWESAFGYFPQVQDSKAYWPMDHWQVEHLEGDLKASFRKHFDEDFWATVPAAPGAVEACHDLVAAGFTLVCVSALDAEFAAARQRNLKELGFPIDQVVATGNDTVGRNPKADAIQALQPVAFVDDYLPYHLGIGSHIHKALILRQPNGSPNAGPDLASVQSQHADLRAFSAWWLGGQEG